MEKFFKIEIIKILIFSVIIIVIKALYAAVIYNKCNSENRTVCSILCALSFPFPIITGVLCITKYKRSLKDVFIVIITFVCSFASIVMFNVLYVYSSPVKHYDREGKPHLFKSEMFFTDREGNKYAFDFDKTGYDYFYVNSTEERLFSDLCYIDSEGYFCYDGDMSISAVDESCCADTDGSLYYPAKFTSFNKDGTINYSFNKGNFSYDRLGKAYTYDYVPYYDAVGNKYFYSFDSDSLKGSYINVVNGEVYENEYSFVDENGYLVCDKSHSFVEQKDIENVKAYKDLNGEIYYWASGISWNEKGKLLDSRGEVIK